ALVFAALATVFLIFIRTNFRLAGRHLKFMVLYGFILSSIALRRSQVRTALHQDLDLASIIASY
ncbi:MAG: hypothetical protein ABUK20_10590, partial [Anaerolineales bacterium]